MKCRLGLPPTLQSIAIAPSSARIRSLCRDGLLPAAIALMQRAQELLHPLDESSFRSLLKLCMHSKSLHHAKLVHARMIIQQCQDPTHRHQHHRPHPLRFTASLCEYLVLALAKCGGLEEAFDVFEGLLCRSVFSWTALICGHLERGNVENALRMYVHMLEEGVIPNEYSLAGLVKACAATECINCGRVLHAHALMEQYEIHGKWPVFSTSLIQMYAKFGHFLESESLFRKCGFHHDIVSWTAMLSAFVEHGQQHKAMEIYEEMREQGMVPNEWTVAACLHGCSTLAQKERSSRASVNRETQDMGRLLHADASRQGFESLGFVGNNLVRMYGSFGHILEAKKAFGMLTSRNSVSWMEMLSTYLEHSKPEEALKLYQQMHEQGAHSDEKTLLAIVKACCMLAANEESVSCREGSWSSPKDISLEIGRALHSDAKRKGTLDSDIFIVNGLLHLYSKCGAVREAEGMFQSCRAHDIISWTVMLSLYAEQGKPVQVLQLYKQMQREGIAPDDHAITTALQACCKLLEIEQGHCLKPHDSAPFEIGKALHGDALSKGLDFDIPLRSQLINLYGRCGKILEAEHIFYCSAERDSIIYSAMLSAYVEQGSGEVKALELFEEMQERGLLTGANDSVFVLTLRACSNIGCVQLCRCIHHSMLWILDDINYSLGASLIHAYGSCMIAADSQSIFDTLEGTDAAVWNALVDAYTRCGEFTEAMNTFNKMLSAKVPPSSVTFLSLLSACCHTGLVDRGVEFFESMCSDRRLNLDIRHYGCLLDLLGRAGNFERLERWLLRMPVQADMEAYLGLLGACRVYGNMHLGKHLFDHLS